MTSVTTVSQDGWDRFSIWGHSAIVRELYTRRCRREVEEMTAHAQAAEMLSRRIGAGDSVLDVGCGSGYFYHSLAARNLPAEYWGIDVCGALIDIGRDILPGFGLPADRLIEARIEDLSGEVDHVVCLNVLTNLDNYHRPLERFLKIARKSVILRESLKQGAEYHYVRDDFLDPGIDLKVHVNHYDISDVTQFVASYGFKPEIVVDRRSGGQPELVIGYPHYWTFLVADRVAADRMTN
ncbi:class I SAM-dependent methyltransferase [Methylocystis sp. B8]|uniref:class I SAM-dependent methyltransferase n=1 Tax=Methylocystis sp. B8 TaxID=544938 RepID=UPI001FF050C5|nr:class I SAM-dependent methyltransferase [Methylocystis sp. B8]